MIIYIKIFFWKHEDILLPAPSPTDDAESKLEKSDMSIVGDVGSWSRSQSTRRKSRSVHSSFRFSDSHNDLSNVRNNATRGTINSVKSRNRKEAPISSLGTNDYDLGYSHFERFEFYVIFPFLVYISTTRFQVLPKNGAELHSYMSLLRPWLDVRKGWHSWTVVTSVAFQVLMTWIITTGL